MPTLTEQQPANTKPKQSAYLVCEGAQCTCAGSKVKAMLKVSSHKKAYINNDKLLATVKDITFEQGAKPFGTCSLSTSQDKSCTPKFEQWLKPYKDIEVEGNQVITDQSELLCLTWKGIITVNTHGQQQTVNETQANNLDRNIAVQVNPLADLVPLNVDTTKKVAVTSIKGELVDDPKYKSVTNQKIEVVQSKDIDDPVDIYQRPGQEATFTAAYKVGGTAALVCWKISGAKGPMHFLQHGSVYKTSFPEVGKYTIEGYGTGGDHNVDIDKKIVEDKKTKIKELQNRSDDKACMLDILVQENKLTGIRHLTSDNVVDKLDKGKFLEAHVRVGVPVTFEPVYLMPPIQTEIDELILLIKDAAGNELKRSKGQPNIIFEAQNSAANYSVEAYFDGSEEKPFTYKFRTALNAVSVIAVTGMETENAKIRPGTTLSFSVSQSKFMNDYKVSQEVLDAEKATIKWYENSDKPVATGITTYSQIYQREGQYVVTCAVKEKSADWFTTKKNAEDDWRFEVTNNYPTSIERKTAGKAKVGKPIKFELKGIFDINYADTRTIQWELSGPETISMPKTKEFLFIPRQSGTYMLTVKMNERTFKRPVSFECITCEIVNGWWTDSDGNILTGNDDEPSNTIGSAGWKQEVVAAFRHVGLNGEEVTVEVFDKDSNGTTLVYTKEMKVPDTDNAATCSFPLNDDVRKEVEKSGWSPNGLLYFTVKAKNGLKLINSGLALPKNENYLEVNENVRVRAYFSDNNDTKRYTTVALDTPVYMQVKTKNLIDEELEFEIWSSKSSSKPLTSRYAFKVDKYGMASIKLNMKAFEPELPTTKDFTMAYFKIFVKKTGHEPFTGENKPKLTVYKTLATSPPSIGTTKAFVMVDVSKERTNQNCECKKNDLIWGNKVSCEFRKKIVQISQELWPNKHLEMANGLMAVINVETSGTFSPSKIELVTYLDSKGEKRKRYQGLSKEDINKLGDNFIGAVGLIQFIQESIDAINKVHSLNITKKKLALMSDLEQLDYVKKYLMLYGLHKKLISPEDIYLHIFAPIGIAKDDNFVLYKAYDNPRYQSEIDSNKNYLANESIDKENNNDKSIQRFEILARYNISYTQGFSRKTKDFPCGTSQINNNYYDPNGILTEMKKLVDTHIAYNQLGIRNEFSEKSLLGLDCSETVAIYLYKLGITDKVIGIDTSLMTTEKDFRTAINSEDIDFVDGSDSESFNPIRGDIFVWRTSDGGHTGIVFDYNKVTDLVTILEAIGKVGSADEITNASNGGHKEKGCSRTAIYNRSGEALNKHAGWIGYFRPKNYTNKL